MRYFLEGCKFTNATKKIQIYQQGDEYVVRKTLTGDTEKTVDIKFKLDTPTEVTLPNGKTTKVMRRKSLSVWAFINQHCFV